ncbi:MAG TPA: MMPL family transporter [Myxococcales bacterium]|nr:MMPL family transporter [Myxococcales bacterium]
MFDLPARILARIVALRVPIVVLFAVLVPLAAMRAARIPSEGGLERLIVASDPDYTATRAFERIFPERLSVLLVFESADPWSPANLSRVDAAVRELRNVPRVSAFSVLDALRRVRPGAPPEELRRLSARTKLFRKQGLVGDHFLSVSAELDVKGPTERDATLAAIDEALARAKAGPVRRVGAPYAESWLEHQSGAASTRYFPFFAALVVVVALLLYRSVRTLFAFLLSMASAVALAVGVGGLLGFTFTIVSVLVPLTVLVTTLASLVYLHSRFVVRPPGVEVREHQLVALRNKLLPVTASTFAAVLGFAALAVSKVRPIREMGIWTAVGLAISWVVAFTLFPALQLLLKTPTHSPAATTRGTYDRFAAFLPGFTRRHRGAFVTAALLLCAAGAVALFGIPGRLRGMSVGVDTLTYIDRSLPLRQDLVWFRENVGDLNVAHAWIHLPRPTATDPEVLRAVDRFQTAIESIPSVLTAVGPTTFLRLRRAFTGLDERLPDDPARFAAAAADLEQLLLTESGLRGYIDPGGLQDLQITIVFQHGDVAGYAALKAAVERAFAATAAPPLAGADLRVVGDQLLREKVGTSLVPTLAQSFALTAALIFVVFLFVFRSGTARVLAMIPSLFAILATFLGMRLLGASLNLATILIATTVLGTTENDQIHFFYHLHERDRAPLAEALEHALRVSGRAIVFATLINAAGFLALSFSTFPPLRQFGLMTSSAFLLALVADFTALPAGLWIVEHRRGRAT